MEINMRFGSIVVLAICALPLSSPAFGGVNWDFDVSGDDGQSKDGWTDTYGATTSLNGGRAAALSDGVTFAYSANHPVSLFSSPAFFLTSAGAINFKLRGGEGKGMDVALNLPDNRSDIPTGNANTGGKQGIALHRLSDGAYVLADQREQFGMDWLSLSFSTSQVAPFAAGGSQNPSGTEQYTLELFDYRYQGDWSYLAIDDVNVVGGTLVPVPEPAALSMLALGAYGLFARRRRVA
jgi:hypothetical protein